MHTLHSLPLQTFKTKSAKDISFYYQFIYIAGCTLTNAYAIVEGLWPIYIPCLIEEALIITLTCLKFVYDREDARTENTVEEGDEELRAN